MPDFRCMIRAARRRETKSNGGVVSGRDGADDGGFFPFLWPVKR